MSKMHWNTVLISGDVTDKLLCTLIVDSYALVLKSLPKKVREEME